MNITHAQAHKEVELLRGPLDLKVRWPSSAAGDCVDLAARVGIRPVEVIRIDRLWLCSALVDMRTGTERLLACEVEVTGAGHANH